MKIRNPKLLSTLAYWVSSGIGSTLRINKIQHPDFNPERPAIYCFWHGDLLLPIISMTKMLNHPAAGFVSHSRDGEILSLWLNKLGYEVARGSSSKKAMSGMMQLLKFARKGYSFGITPDGPRGPRFHVNDGVAFLAKYSKLPVIPIGVYYDNAKVFEKSWDKFSLPKLFSKVVMYYGKPLTFDETSENKTQIKEALFEAKRLAEKWHQDHFFIDGLVEPCPY